MRRDVAALLLVIQTDEVLFTGLPVDRITGLHRCGGPIACFATPEAPETRVEARLFRFLRAFLPATS